MKTVRIKRKPVEIIGFQFNKKEALKLISKNLEGSLINGVYFPYIENRFYMQVSGICVMVHDKDWIIEYDNKHHQIKPDVFKKNYEIMK